MIRVTNVDIFTYKHIVIRGTNCIGHYIQMTGDRGQMMATIITFDEEMIRQDALNPKVPDWCQQGVYFMKDGTVVGRGKIVSRRDSAEVSVLPDDDAARALFDDEATSVRIPLTYSMYTDGGPLPGAYFIDETEERYKGTTIIAVEIYDIQQRKHLQGDVVEGSDNQT